jgi:HK97 family phage prohead protease
METNLEYRAFNLENVSTDENKKTITGRAIVYNSLSNKLRTSTGDFFREMVMPGALTDCIERNDILALAHHNQDQVLGRKSAGTLTLEDRADGLYATIDCPDTSFGKDTLISAKRGDLKGFSFGFRPIKQRTFSRDGEKIRELTAIDCREISVVGNPAYNETTLACRNEDFVDEKAAPTEVRVETPAPIAPPAAETPAEPQATPTLSEVEMKHIQMRHNLNSYKLRGGNDAS